MGSATVNRMEVDVGVMEELLPSETDKNRRLADTIVHEKIHWQDWADDNDLDIHHDVVETRAAEIVEELSAFLSTCYTDWEQQRSIVYVL